MQIAHNGDTQEAATEVISQYGVVSNMTCMSVCTSRLVGGLVKINFIWVNIGAITSLMDIAYTRSYPNW